jgi:hypothetical protein
MPTNARTVARSCVSDGAADELLDFSQHRRSLDQLAAERRSCVSKGMPDVTLRHLIARWALVSLSALTLAVTPLRSRFQVRGGFSCEVAAPFERWVAGVLNWGHLVAYGTLLGVGSLAFGTRRLVPIGAFVLAVSVAVELEEAVFTVGHCRVRDLLPNVLAVAVTGLCCWAIARRQHVGK